MRITPSASETTVYLLAPERDLRADDLRVGLLQSRGSSMRPGFQMHSSSSALWSDVIDHSQKPLASLDGLALKARVAIRFI